MLSQTADYQPQTVADTRQLTREEWLALRRKGIGGSDAAMILGISPFRTAADLYYDKLDLATEDDSGNWVAMRIGTLLEDLIAEIFQKKTGLELVPTYYMYRHPLYPFMLADLDYLVRLPDGSLAILEIKSTNYHAKDHWFWGEAPIVPPHYEAQARHYMCVMNIDRIFFCCLYGNNEDETIIRELLRDPLYESEMIFLENHFWTHHIQAKSPPLYTESATLILESVQRHYGAADINAPEMVLKKSAGDAARYLFLQNQKKNAEYLSKDLDDEIAKHKALIAAEMGKCCAARTFIHGEPYLVTYKPSYRQTMSKDALFRLKLHHPDIYEQFVSITESRRLYIKKQKQEAA